MKVFNAVVVGTGFIGPVHVEALGRAGVRVAGIVGSSAEKSRRAAHQLRLPSTYSSLDEALADPSIDAIHLATPNRFHYAQATSVLLAGKHVVCEKPLAMTSSESAQLVQLASECRLAAAVAYNIRYYPLCYESAARVRHGGFGSLLHVHGSYAQDWLLRSSDFNWRVVAEDGGQLRAVADIGTHWLDLVQFLCGHKIVAVCADLRTVHPKRSRPTGSTETFSSNSTTPGADSVAITTEDCGSVMLRFSNGANGCLWVSQTTAGRKNCLRFEMAGSEQTIAWNSESPNELWVGHRARPNELLIRDPALMHTSAASVCNYPGGHNEGFPDTFKQLFKNFYDYIDAGDLRAPSTFPTFDDGHYEILLCEAILQSHLARKWIDVEPTHTN